MQIHHIPLAAISAHAFLRDRTAPDPAAQADLLHSILADGLRQPIELVELSEPFTAAPMPLSPACAA